MFLLTKKRHQSDLFLPPRLSGTSSGYEKNDVGSGEQVMKKDTKKKSDSNLGNVKRVEKEKEAGVIIKGKPVITYFETGTKIPTKHAGIIRVKKQSMHDMFQ